MDNNNTESGNITVSSTSVSTTVSSNNSTNTYTSTNPSVIDVKESFETWKTDNKTRYVLPQLLCRNRVEEKMTIENNASDAIVWNIIYLTTDKCFPSASPTLEQKVNALNWLQRFKKYLNRVIAAEVKATYCNMANQEKWAVLREGGETFSSFHELVKRTKYCAGKEV